VTISKDTLFAAAVTLQAGRPGATFAWALAQVMDNADHFAGACAGASQPHPNPAQVSLDDEALD
jgi:hypothetical protein